jgi:ribosome-associated protein
VDDLVAGRLVIPAADLEETFVTSGGPGGQHANRTESAVRLRFDIAGSSLEPATKATLLERLDAVVEVNASESRSQFRNRAIARKRLAEVIEEALIPRARRRPTKPTRASRRKRLDQKRARSKVKRMRKKPADEDFE